MSARRGTRQGLRLALACAAAVTLAHQAGAQDVDLSGLWEFTTTDGETRGCTISGTAQMSRSATPGRYAIEMQANQSCGGDDTHSRTHQTCKGAQNGDFIRIGCRLVWAESPGYIADGYDLDVVDADTLEGTLTVLWSAPAVWRRASGVIV